MILVLLTECWRFHSGRVCYGSRKQDQKMYMYVPLSLAQLKSGAVTGLVQQPCRRWRQVAPLNRWIAVLSCIALPADLAPGPPGGAWFSSSSTSMRIGSRLCGRFDYPSKGLTAALLASFCHVSQPLVHPIFWYPQLAIQTGFSGTIGLIVWEMTSSCTARMLPY